MQRFMKNKTNRYRKPLDPLEIDSLGLGGRLSSGILFVVSDKAVSIAGPTSLW
jgi:amino acid permease